MTDRGATSFILAAMKKPRKELELIRDDPAKIATAAAYHNIKPEWAKFWIGEELNRGRR